MQWPCYYGIDFASRAELIAPGLSVDDIRTSIGRIRSATSLSTGSSRATGIAKDHLCRACFDGDTRGSGRPGLRSKHVLGDRLSSYADAGVDVEAGRARGRTDARADRRDDAPEVVGDLGGFAGLFDASALARYKRPLLATATDGVGTKIAVARAMDIHDTIGIDLVAMVVDDLVVCGAEPLFMTDYAATGKVVPERIAAIVS